MRMLKQDMAFPQQPAVGHGLKGGRPGMPGRLGFAAARNASRRQVDSAQTTKGGAQGALRQRRIGHG